MPSAFNGASHEGAPLFALRALDSPGIGVSITVANRRQLIMASKNKLCSLHNLHSELGAKNAVLGAGCQNAALKASMAPGQV